MRPLFLLLAGLTALLNLGSARAETAGSPQVQVRLIASRSAAHPGEEILIGLQQKIAPGWHTYWINPGDSGLATRIAWTLPAGATAGAILWPTPERFQLGELINYGYKDEVILLSPLKLPADSPVGSSFRVRARVSWLACLEVCVPQKADLELSLPVLAPGQTSGIDPLVVQALADLPRPLPGTFRFESRPDGLRLKISGEDLVATARSFRFYPRDAGRVDNGAPQRVSVGEDGVLIRMQARESAVGDTGSLAGLLVMDDAAAGGGSRAYTLNWPMAEGVGAPVTRISSGPEPAGSRGAAGMESVTLIPALLLAFLGGIILNLMPCVFPVLSLKALSLLRHSNASPAENRLHGLAYTLGILSSFTLLAGVLIVLKQGGASIGWGFQFQSPLFVLVVAWLIFAVALSLSGFFTIGNGVTGLGASLADRGGYAGSFFTGTLATIVATPCTAPFMGAAMGFALSQPAPVLLLVFLGLGMGLALPYLLLCNWPVLQRRLPRPGPWMESLRQILAFPMYATSIWLIWVLARQCGPNGVALALAGMLAIAFAVWLHVGARGGSERARRGTSTAVTAILLLTLLAGYVGITAQPAYAQSKPVPASQNWSAYSAERLAALRAKGQPVFLNFTAAWCLTCLANEKLSLGTAQVAEGFRQAGVTYLKGDWTNQDPAITRYLNEAGRSGVPLYVFYPAGKNSSPVILPQLLTPAMILSAVQRGAGS